MENEKDIQRQIKQMIKNAQTMEPEQIDAKSVIQTPKVDIDDERVKKEFLKKFMEAGEDGSN